MRIIDADELCEGRVENDPVRIAAMCAPTIEAVPVVRCKDCKYRTWFCPGYGCGNYNSPFYIGADEEVPIMTKPDDFCSYGEKDRQKEGVI